MATRPMGNKSQKFTELKFRTNDQPNNNRPLRLEVRYLV